MALPKQWQVVRLGDLAHVEYGKATPKQAGKIPVIGSGGVFGSTDVSLIDEPTIVIGRKGTAGSLYLTQGPSHPSDTTFFLEWKGTQDVEFLYYAMSLHRLSGEHARTTMPSLQRADVESLVLPWPPAAEQRAISTVLRSLGHEIELTELVIEATGKLKQALMARLFRYGLSHSVGLDQVRLSETQLGPLPVDWQVMRLGDVVEIARGQVDPKEPPYSSMIHVGPENIESGTGRLLNMTTAESLGLISGKYLFGPEDILYSKIRPYLRKAAVVDFVGVCSADMYPVRVTDKRLSRDFLFHYLLSDAFTSQAVALQDRTGIPKLNRDQLSGLLVPLPSTSEQSGIARVLNGADSKVKAEQERCRILRELSDLLLRQLLTGSRRVGTASVTSHG